MRDPGSTARTWLRVLVVAGLCLVPVAELLLLRDQLPERFASHFGGSGRADGWSSQSGFLATWLVTGATMALLFGPVTTWAVRRVRRNPDGVNLPRSVRDRLRADPAAREQVAGALAVYMDVLGVLVAGMLLLVGHAVVRANLLPEPALDAAWILAPLVAVLGWSFGGLAWMLWRMMRA